MCWIEEVEMDDLKTSRSIFGNQFPNFDMLDAKGRIGSKENAINGKRVDSAQKETLSVSATMKINVEKHCNCPLLVQNRRRTAIGKFSSKVKASQRPESVWEEISKTV